MTVYVGSEKIKDTGEYGVYLGSQNTNCLTYTPKNVNLELNNGTLTLKAGSRVYVPNGKNADGSFKFDEVVVENDKIIIRTGAGTRMVFLGVNNRGTDSNIDYVVSSGSAPTTTNSIRWYDTSENIIKEYINSEWKQSGYYRTLPLAIVTADTNGYTSIDQIFDWCGYIGSTLFRLPNVKYQKAYGLNSDGTYKIIKTTTDKVVVRNQTWSVSGTLVDYYNKLEILDSKGLLEVEETLPIPQAYWERCYVKSENKWYYHDSENLTWREVTNGDVNKIADCSVDVSTNTVTLTPYTAQPEMTLIPFNAIYNGSDLVYQYLPNPTTFNAGSNLVTYTVPKGCTKLGIDCVASKGGTFTAVGGNGGRVTCDLSVTEGQTLYITVGAIPTDNATVTYNASDIRIGGTEYANRIIVAGGGGNGATGDRTQSVGGAGGGLTGTAGIGIDNAGGGQGGTQTAGGAGGTISTAYGQVGKAGSLGLGGAGGNNVGGVGGSGYYGGGGGGYATYYGGWGGGGGGGSSYTSSACSNVVHTQGYQNGAGYIKITPKK